MGPRHAKVCLLAYADSENPDQPARLRSPIRAFTVGLHNYCIQKNVSMESKRPDETLS